MKYLSLAVSVILLQLSCNSSRDDSTSGVINIARAHGLDNFDKVKSIEFTFNVQRDTTHTSRHWKWIPETNMVTFTDNDKSATTFKRYDTGTVELKELNAKFTNDEYWLVFPFHLVWDKGYKLEQNDAATAPISGQKYHKYTVTYNDKDGFTPGDMYDLYTDQSQIVREWAFHKKAAPEPSLITTWEDYEEFAGLKIAKDHRTKDGKFRLYFTDLRVE